MKTITHEYVYTRETKGTWVYEVKLDKGERISGPTACYILKSEYPVKPCERIKGTFEAVVKP